MRVLVTGAAGFIGSVVAERLLAEGHAVVGFDNLSTGRREAVPEGVEFIFGDLWYASDIGQAMRGVDVVCHLAAEAAIDHRNPGKFYAANVAGGLNLLDAMVQAGVKRLIVSSTAAVYGVPAEVPIREDAPTVPCNAYGESKLAFERMLRWWERAHGFKSVVLRFYNVAGSSPTRGEQRKHEAHLLPMALDAALSGDELCLTGAEQDTPDRTAIRDYVSVLDIARAFSMSLAGDAQPGMQVYNLGSGTGHSNLEIVQAVKRVTGRDFPVVRRPNRSGDPPVLVADIGKARRELGWEPQHSDLDEIIASAWAWRQKMAKMRAQSGS